jgi:opacity protein-like surface antigen
VRGLITLSKGEPANDMTGARLVGRWRISDDWRIGVAFDSLTFDYETPNKALGIVAVSVVDGTNDLSRVAVFVERRFDTRRRWDPYWLAGVGTASVDAPNVAGARTGGGAFDIATVADDEIHFFAGGGLQRQVGKDWLLDATFTFEHHDTNYQLLDRISGARGSIGSHSPYGIALGASYRF